MVYWHGDDQCSNSQKLTDFADAVEMHKSKANLNQPVFIITGPYVFMRHGSQARIDKCIAKAQKLGDLPSQDEALLAPYIEKTPPIPFDPSREEYEPNPYAKVYKHK